MIKLTKEEFISKAQLIHNNKYSYRLVDYINTRTKVVIMCNTCNKEFLQDPHSHLKGKGCKECCNQIRNLKNKTNGILIAAQAAKDFIIKARTIHGNKYQYDNSQYVNNRVNISIHCKACSKDFMQLPSHHLRGSGCKICAIKNKQSTSGWTKTSFTTACNKNNYGVGTLYILQCFNDNERFYKIGITSRSVKIRFDSKGRMPYKYEIIKEITGDPGYIYNLEKELHSINKPNRYNPIIEFPGSALECFSSVLSVQ